jgi:hypothetical protein
MNYFSGVDIVGLVIDDSYQTNDLIEAEDHKYVKIRGSPVCKCQCTLTHPNPRPSLLDCPMRSHA